MQRDKRRIRFPRAAYQRRLWVIMDELADWEDNFVIKASFTDSPVLARKCLERAYAIHEVWHDLNRAQEDWKAWT